VETGLLCGRCGTPICPRCLVQTPVGARCPDCANVRRLPTVDLSPVYLLRGLGAALLSGTVVGGAWGYLSGGRNNFVGFFLIFIAIGIGWAISEAIGAATNRKRGPALQAMAVAAVVIAYFVRNIVGYDALLVRGDIWGVIAAGIAAVYAWSRLSR
jgi:hypothetical protein